MRNGKNSETGVLNHLRVRTSQMMMEEIEVAIAHLCGSRLLTRVASEAPQVLVCKV